MAHHPARAIGMHPSHPRRPRDRLFGCGASGIYMDFPWTSHAPSLTGGYAPAPAAGLDSERLIRDVLFLGTLLLVWFTTAPFPDLGDPRLLDSSTQGDFLNQAATVLVTGALAAFALLKRSPLVGR